jgi:translocation and assembly module TamB
LHVAGGRLAIAELGEWTDLAADVKITDEAVELSRLELRRGKGRLSARGALRGLTQKEARLDGAVSVASLPLAKSGMTLATVTVEATATGTYRDGTLEVELNVPRGLVQLPSKQPRNLQPLDGRSDVVVGRAEGKAAEGEAASPGGAPAERPLAIRIHAVVPKGLFVKSDDPHVDLELKADVRYEHAGSEEYLAGTVEVVRGTVEPIGGRNFVIDRGVVQFTGGPPSAALLDVSARYTNPAAVVTVKVTGTVRKPEVKLSSVPQLDDSQIALLIATGRTDAKAGGASVGNLGTVAGSEAGMAALGAVATQAFRNIVQNKLPVDTVALEAGAFRAGKYVTDRIYVSYLLRWDADPTKNENQEEVRVEYQIAPRFIFESRYGNAQSGSASLIWSKDY